jgi:hypothetical protein
MMVIVEQSVEWWLAGEMEVLGENLPQCPLFFILSGYCGHYWPIVSAPDDRWCWLWRNWWNEHWQGKSKYSEKTCPSATLSTTDLTWLDPGLNPGRHGGKPAANRLSYGAACHSAPLSTTNLTWPGLEPGLPRWEAGCLTVWAVAQPCTLDLLCVLLAWSSLLTLKKEAVHFSNGLNGITSYKILPVLVTTVRILYFTVN